VNKLGRKKITAKKNEKKGVGNVQTFTAKDLCSGDLRRRNHNKRWKCTTKRVYSMILDKGKKKNERVCQTSGERKKDVNAKDAAPRRRKRGNRILPSIAAITRGELCFSRPRVTSL